MEEQQQQQLEEELPKCWICFGDETDSAGLRWVKPCRCSLIGHEHCLLNWIAEKQRERGNSRAKVSCPQCSEPYQTVEERTVILSMLEAGDTLIQVNVPILTAAGFTVACIIACTTYGAYTVFSMCGAEEGERLLGTYHPWSMKVWMGLPFIPFSLILSRTRGLDPILPLIPLALLGSEQARMGIWPPTPAVAMILLPWARLIYTSVLDVITSNLTKRWIRLFRPPPTLANTATSATAFDEGELKEIALVERPKPLRMAIGALLFPTISSMCGKLLASSASPCGKWFRRTFPTMFLRSVVGGCAFIAVKDAINLIYKYQKIKQRRSRKIKQWGDK